MSVTGPVSLACDHGDMAREEPRTVRRELTRLLGINAFVYVMATVFLVGVHFRLVQGRRGLDIFEDTAVAAGVMGGMAGPLLVYLSSDIRTRGNLAARSTGLPLISMVVVLVSGVLSPVGLLMWRPIIGDDAPAGSVYDVITTSPTAWFFVTTFALTIFACSHAFCLPFLGEGVSPVLRVTVFLPLWMGSFLLWPFLAHTFLGEPPQLGLAVLFGVLALVLIGVMLVILNLVQKAGVSARTLRRPHR